MDNSDNMLIDEGFQIEKYWRIIKPKVHWPLILSLIFVSAVFVKSSMKKPMYKAAGLLMIDPEKDIINFGNRYGMTDWKNEYFNTQIEILQSRSLANAVYDEIGIYPEGLSIRPIELTRLVNVSASSPVAEDSARMINTLFDKLIEFNLAVKTRASRETSEYIRKQIKGLRNNLAQKESELQEYSKRKDLFYLSRKDSTIVEKFSDLNRAYTQAQINRVNKESIYMELKGMKFENYSEVKNDSVISNLKSSYSNLESEYRKKAQIFKESYPEMAQLRSQLKTLENQLNKETRERAGKTLQEAKTAYLSAKKEEDSLLELLNKQKGTMVTSKSNAIYYNSLEIEVSNMNNMLNYLTRRQKESLLTSKEGLQTTNIRVVDRAEVPEFPMSGGRNRLMIMALFFGGGLGIGLIFLFDFLDNTLKTPDDVKLMLNIPTLGMIPSSEGKSGISYSSYYYGDKKKAEKKGVIKNIELINFRDPESPFSEHYRSIRTSILLSTPKEPPKIISVSSAVPSEGKTVTVVNLAISFAQLGKKVLIIDGDLRKPRIHKIFKLKNTVGLSSYLAGRVEVREISQKTHINNIFVIPSGPLPPNPVELIDSKMMSDLLQKLQAGVDYIFIDTPPLIGIVDPIIMGKHSDGMIIVNWAGNTRIDPTKKAKEEVDKFGVNILGIVLNKLDFRKNEASYQYAYNYHYTYQYREE